MDGLAIKNLFDREFLFELALIIFNRLTIALNAAGSLTG